jgi:hypothetical protein
VNPTGVLHLLLIHLPAAEVDRRVERLLPFCVAPSRLLVAYGGPEEEFAAIVHPDKIFLDDPRLRTRDHQREKQSYTQVFQFAARWLAERPELGYVYVGEYDHLPLVADFHARLIARLEREGADVLAHQLARRDGTSCPYCLHQMIEPRFPSWLAEISVRRDKGAVFNMLGTGSFWTRRAFLEVARWSEPFPMYLELYLPTLAHHRGFRLRDFKEQSRFVSAEGERSGEIAAARAAGAWSLHPVKTLS